jgi:uncharacterized membrane protein
MKTKMAVLALIIVMSVCSLAYAFDGGRGRGPAKKGFQYELLAQLPAEKEMLFHQTMRDVRENGSELRSQIKALREDIREIMTADQFDEKLFREKTSQLEALQMKKHATMEEATVILAKQFTADERKILVRLLPGKTGYGRHARGRRDS